MELYDPEHPSISGSYFYLRLDSSVVYNLSNYLKHGDLLLVIDGSYIGRISMVCDKLFSQSKLKNGIIKVESPYSQTLGHLVLVKNTVHHFIPFEDGGFAIDNQIYKRRKSSHW